MAEMEAETVQDFMKPAKGTFRLRSKCVFLTYPRCTSPPEDLVKHLMNMPRKPSKFIVVQEAHKDGTPHLHAIVEYDRMLETLKSTYYDFDGYHGNYCQTRSYPAAIRYLKKSGTPISNWDYDAYLKGQVKQGNLRVDYSEINSIAREEGVMGLVDKGLIPIEKAPQWQRGIQLVENIINKAPVFDSTIIKLPMTYKPYQTMDYPVDLTDPSRRHLWFYGGTGTGKTYTAEHQELRSYCIPKNRDWVGYQGEQLLILNEFKGEFTPTELIDIMEARQQNVKGSSCALPKEVLLTVTSNFSLRQCYTNLNAANDEQLSALERRFAEVEFTEKHPSCPQGRMHIVLNAQATLVFPQKRLPDTSQDVQPGKRPRVDF